MDFFPFCKWVIGINSIKWFLIQCVSLVSIFTPLPVNAQAISNPLEKASEYIYKDMHNHRLGGDMQARLEEGKSHLFALENLPDRNRLITESICKLRFYLAAAYQFDVLNTRKICRDYYESAMNYFDTLLVGNLEQFDIVTAYANESKVADWERRIRWIERMVKELASTGDPMHKQQARFVLCRIRAYLSIKYEYERDKATQICKEFFDELDYSSLMDSDLLGLTFPLGTQSHGERPKILRKLEYNRHYNRHSTDEETIKFLLISNYFELKNFDKILQIFSQSPAEDIEYSYLGYAQLATGNLDVARQSFEYAVNILKRGILVHEPAISRNSTVFLGLDFSGHDMSSGEFTGLAMIQLRQNRFAEALEYVEQSRAMGLRYILGSKNFESLKFNEMQSVAKSQNVTFVVYSIMPNLGTDPEHQSDLGIYVLQPDGDLHFELVPLNQLSTVVASVSQSLARGGFRQPVTILVLTLSGGVALLLLLSAIVLFLYFKKPIIATSVVLLSFLSSLPLVALTSGHVASEQPSTLAVAQRVSFKRLINTAFVFARSGTRSSLPGSLRTDPACTSQDSCLASLYEILIKPIEQYLPQDSNAQVVFLPEGELYKVPFYALKDRNGKQVIDKHTISVTPSIQIFKKLVEKPAAKTKGALVVGNPTMPTMSLNTEVQDDVPELSPLPGSEREAKKIGQIFGTSALIGSQATKRNVVLRMKSANIIHLATHGLPHDWGVIVLAPESGDSGLLDATSISGLELDSDLIVLSACDTGTGILSGEGAIGLARPFIIAGARTVIASLWPIPDESTSEMMVDFYKNLQSSPNKAQALRKAMLKTREKYPDPQFWAGFNLVGKP